MADFHVKRIFGCFRNINQYSLAHNYCGFGWLRNILNQYSLTHNYCCFTRNKSSSSYRPTWSGLPDVAIMKIFGQLQAGDRARLMVVSKSWKRIFGRDDLPTPPELWRFSLFCDLDLEQKHVKFLSSSEGFREYNFKVPDFRKNSGKVWLCGSSGGWLIVATGNKFDPDLFLWNPLNDVVMTLPRLSSALHRLPRALGAGPEEYNISSYIKRVVVFSQECIVAVVVSQPYEDGIQDLLFICTPKDRKWMVFGRHYFHKLSDILFHDGKLYVLAKHRTNDKDTKSNYTSTKIRLSKCQVQVCIMCLDYKENGSVNYNKHINPVLNITHRNKISEHLVELSGQLLVMVVVFDLFAYNNMGDGPVRSFDCHQIQRIEVRKVDGLEKVASLGDEHLVTLAETGSLAVPPSAAGEHDSGIVFTTQCGRGILGNQDDVDDIEYVVHEQGIFDLDTNIIHNYRAQFLTYPGQVISGWHTPKLF